MVHSFTYLSYPFACSKDEPKEDFNKKYIKCIKYLRKISGRVHHITTDLEASTLANSLNKSVKISDTLCRNCRPYLYLTLSKKTSGNNDVAAMNLQLSQESLQSSSQQTSKSSTASNPIYVSLENLASIEIVEMPFKRVVITERCCCYVHRPQFTCSI